MVSTAIYRAIMQACEARRIELGIAMATVDEMAGTQDGYYAKMLFPDTPTGRCAQWPTLQLVIEALFGRDCQVVISGENERQLAALSSDRGQSHKYREYRHWRHAKHFRDLGGLGGKKRAERLTPIQRSAIARKAGKARARKAKQAQRQGDKHKRENATRATGPECRDGQAGPTASR